MRAEANAKPARTASERPSIENSERSGGDFRHPARCGRGKEDSPGQIRTAVARSPFGPRGTDPEPRITGPRPHRGHDWPLDHGASNAIQWRGRILSFLSWRLP